MKRWIHASTDNKDWIQQIQDIIEVCDPKDTGSKAAYNRCIQQLKKQLGYTDAEANRILKDTFCWDCTDVTAATTTIEKAKSDCQWMNGLFWDIDGHVHTITGVNGYPLFSCEVTEDWISEDTYEPVEKKSWYTIEEDDNGHAFIRSRKNRDFKLYLNSAFNYMDLVPEEFDELDFLREDMNKNMPDTLRSILSRYISEADEGDYYNSVKVIYNDQMTIYDGHSLEEAKAKLKDYLDIEAKSEWHDDKIRIYIYSDCDEDDYTPSATRGDYSPSNPWDAPGMSIKDFI